MNFVSHERLVRDVREWSADLPGDIAAVAGVPRSGILPATLLALHRNIHLVTVDELREGRSPWFDSLRRCCGTVGRCLVVEDCVNTGGTLDAVRRQLAGRNDCLFGAVYRAPGSPSLDFSFREIPFPRVFEWNVFHHAILEKTCLDLDGVICRDPVEPERDDGSFARWIEQAPPLNVPTWPVYAVVTSRLEKYRAETSAWLLRHGVRFERLIMSPHETAAARRRAGDHAERKAEFYRDSPAELFIESCRVQAREIALVSGKPVISVEGWELFRGA